MRSISGKLAVGSALDAYDRLSDAEKTNYNAMVAKLTDEFINPREKERFNNKIDFNRRQKGQSLKDFMNEIKRDMKKYSNSPSTLRTAEGIILNPEREAQGVRRFIRGMRDAQGLRLGLLGASHSPYLRGFGKDIGPRHQSRHPI